MTAATTTTEPRQHVPAALVEKRRAEKAAREAKAAGQPETVREGKRFDSVKQPDGSIEMVEKKAARKPRATKAAKAERSAKAKAAAKSRTLDRVEPEQVRTVLGESGLTQKEAAAAVGRSVSLVRGWLGEGGTVKANGKVTNPPLAAHRLKEVTKTWMTAGAAKRKAAAKAAAK